jgi:glutamine synthetase
MDSLESKDLNQEIHELTNTLKDQFSMIPKLGVEIEFYLRDKVGDLCSDEQIEKFRDNLLAKNILLTEENGPQQFEIQINHTSDISKLIDEISLAKSLLNSLADSLGLKAIFRPKPFKAAHGSSMHFHLSLHDKTEHNIFSDNTINTNELLNNIINAILSMLNQYMHFMCGDDAEEYQRFIPNFMAPVNVSWGGNNRTTAIRVPESTSYNRRIEFRIPSASCEPQKIIHFLLLATINGIKHPSWPIKRTYGNASDEQYDELKKLPYTAHEAKTMRLTHSSWDNKKIID